MVKYLQVWLTFYQMLTAETASSLCIQIMVFGHSSPTTKASLTEILQVTQLSSRHFSKRFSKHYSKFLFNDELKWTTWIILVFIHSRFDLADATIYLFSLRKLVSQLRCGCLVVSELPVK